MRISLVTLCLLAWSSPLLACPICFQVEQGPVTSGVRAAVVVLMAVTTSVLGGFAVFIVNFSRRTRNLGTPEPRNPPSHAAARFGEAGPS